MIMSDFKLDTRPWPDQTFYKRGIVLKGKALYDGMNGKMLLDFDSLIKLL